MDKSFEINLSEFNEGAGEADKKLVNSSLFDDVLAEVLEFSGVSKKKIK